jgi:hypothetical protein
MPIILGGDTFWLPLATTIAVGVGFSAILGLYFAPALFFLPGIFPRKRAQQARKAVVDARLDGTQTAQA